MAGTGTVELAGCTPTCPATRTVTVLGPIVMSAGLSTVPCTTPYPSVASSALGTWRLVKLTGMPASSDSSTSLSSGDHALSSLMSPKLRPAAVKGKGWLPTRNTLLGRYARNCGAA